jgi:hypothetical protein
MSQAVRRALALAILALLVLAAWALVAAPLIGAVQARREEVASLAAQRARLQAGAARLPELAARQQALRARLAADGGLWQGGNPAMIAAGMQDRLRQAVAAGGGVVRSSSEIRGGTESGLIRIRVRLVIEAPLAELERALTAIGTARPDLFIDAVSIVAPARPAPDMPPLLGVEMEISGYALAGPE